VINSSFYRSETTNQLLAAKASHEVTWINKIAEHSDGNFVVIPWTADEVKGEKLKELF
jgi:arsenite-transporting ATPase